MVLLLYVDVQGNVSTDFLEGFPGVDVTGSRRRPGGQDRMTRPTDIWGLRGNRPGMLARVSSMDPDLDGVAELYAAACPGLIGYLTVLGGNRADAEEIAQEAFVRLLESWPRLAEYDDPRGWLRLVATRMLISRARRRKVAQRALPRLGGATTTEAPTGERLDLAAALATLPIGSRAVVLLHHVHDLPVEEIANQLRIPVGTVKSRLSRARAALAPLVSEGTLS